MYVDYLQCTVSKCSLISTQWEQFKLFISKNDNSSVNIVQVYFNLNVIGKSIHLNQKIDKS